MGNGHWIFFVLFAAFEAISYHSTALAVSCRDLFTESTPKNHADQSPERIRGTPEIMIPLEVNLEEISFAYDPLLYFSKSIRDEMTQARLLRLKESKKHRELIRAGHDMLLSGRVSRGTLDHITKGDFESFDLYGDGRTLPLLNGGLHSTEGLRAFLEKRPDLISHDWAHSLIINPRKGIRVGGVWYEFPMYSNGVRVVQFPVIAFNRNGRKSAKAPFKYGQTFSPGTKTLFPSFFSEKEILAAIAAVIRQNPNPTSRLIRGTYETFNVSGPFSLPTLEGTPPWISRYFKKLGEDLPYYWFAKEVAISIRLVVGLTETGEVATAYPDQIQPGFGEKETIPFSSDPSSPLNGLTMTRERVVPRAGISEQEFRRLLHFRPELGIFPIKDPESRITLLEQFEALYQQVLRQDRENSLSTPSPELEDLQRTIETIRREGY